MVEKRPRMLRPTEVRLSSYKEQNRKVLNRAEVERDLSASASQTRSLVLCLWRESRCRSQRDEICLFVPCKVKRSPYSSFKARAPAKFATWTPSWRLSPRDPPRSRTCSSSRHRSSCYLGARLFRSRSFLFEESRERLNSGKCRRSSASMKGSNS